MLNMHDNEASDIGHQPYLVEDNNVMLNNLRHHGDIVVNREGKQVISTLPFHINPFAAFV